MKIDMEKTEEQREEIINFIEGGLIKDRTNFECPCCNHYTSFYSWLGCKEHNFGYEYPFKKYRNCYFNFLRHLNAKIRLSGDKKHIKLLIDIFGKEKSYSILKNMAKKNMLVAIRLSKIVKELKNGI